MAGAMFMSRLIRQEIININEMRENKSAWLPTKSNLAININTHPISEGNSFPGYP
jgi:hypothetical protein